MHKPPNTLKVLIGEDDPALQSIVLECLKHHHFLPTAVSNILDFYKAFGSDSFDVVIIDLGLPDGNGMDLVDYIKNLSNDIGVVIMSAKTSPEQRALGYQHRCDIYITKPFNCVELGMSINNLVQHLTPISTTDQTQQSLWSYNHDEQLLTAPNGQQVTLTTKEDIVVNQIVRANSAVVPRSELMKSLGYEKVPLSNSLDAIVQRIRKKISDQQLDINSPIRTVHGFGFKFVSTPYKLNTDL
jgi:DNA-binding response OmpR family regulator